MLNLWLGTFIAEAILLGVKPLWRLRRQFAAAIVIYIAISSLFLIVRLGWAVGLVIGVVALFRIGNMGRIIKGRMHPLYLLQVCRRTAVGLFLLQSALVLLVTLGILWNKSYLVWLPMIQLAFGAGLAFVAIRNIRKLRFTMPQEYLVDRELPTVTVAIPARNETTDLEECLRAVLANDYPKMEVIVLDDCSQGRTAEIIRSFAHDGVRFIQGTAPQDRWLAKNQAYQQLYEEATGEFMVYCGVDVRLGPHAIRSMVNVLHDRGKAMLSVLPVRDRSTPASAFIQPMRYWWEIALPRRFFNRPPVLSTCWIINRHALKKLGAFAAVSHAILPEGFLARELVKTDSYSFIRSSNELEVRTVKSLADQRATSIRTSYPKIRRRPENALFLTIVSTFFLVGPFLALLAGIWVKGWFVLPLILSCLLLVTTHVAIMLVSDPANALLAALTYPLAIIVETINGYTSMIQYEFFTVEWKDRNICIPVMHVIPKLPAMPENSGKA